MRNADHGGDFDQAKHPSPRAPVLTGEQARQARWGKPVLWILIISTTAAFVGVLGALGMVG
jgi:hypothetical protein